MIIRKQYHLRQIGDDYVIIPMGKTALEFNGMITVNEQGAFLWQQLSNEISEAQLVDTLLAEYETDRQTAEADVKDFVNFLRQCKILE